MYGKKEHPKEPKPVLRYDPEHSAIAAPEGTRIITLSDLHLFISHREVHGGGRKHCYTDEEIIATLKHALKEADHVVLNGDIFETLYDGFGGDKQKARDKAIETLKELVQTAKEHGSHLHYVDGNHDDGNKFIKRLQELEAEFPEQFSFHPAALRIHSAFFTHGDLLLRSGNQGITVVERLLSREKYAGDNFTGFLHGENQVHDLDSEPALLRFAHMVEARLNAHGVQRLIQAWEDATMAPDKTFVRLWETLVKANQDHPELLDAVTKQDGSVVPPVKRLITGHTHIPYTGLSLGYREMAKFPVEYSDVEGDNTGSALPPRHTEKFNMLRHTVKGKGFEVENLQVLFTGDENALTFASRIHGQGRDR